MRSKAVVFIVALLVVTISNYITITSVVYIKNLGNEVINLRNIYYVVSMIFQLAAALLGAFYFFKNKLDLKSQEEKSRKNELLKHLVEEFKKINHHLNDFFYHKHESDKSFKEFKDLIQEQFSLISIFIECNEDLLCFSNEELNILVSPSSIIQGDNTYRLSSVEEVKKHDLTLVQSQFSTSVLSALKTCWNKIQ